MRVLEPEEFVKNRIKLHKNDEKILSLLTRNVRLPLSKIARIVRLSRQSVEYRIKVMERHHLLAGSRAVINIKKLGYSSFHFFLTLQDLHDEKELLSRCKQSPVVNALIIYSGRWNYELSIMAKDPKEALDHFLRIIEGLSILDYAPTILLQTIKSSVLPSLEKAKAFQLKYIRNDPSFSKQFSLDPIQYKADEKDREILYHLSQDCQLTLSDLGKKLKLTNDAIAYRIKKLVRGGYIIHFRPVIDYATLGLSIETVLVKVHARNATIDEKIKSYVQQNHFIVWATSLFGAWDYLIYILHDKQEEIHEFIKDLKDNFSEHLLSYEILFAYKEHKYSYMTEEMR